MLPVAGAIFTSRAPKSICGRRAQGAWRGRIFLSSKTIQGGVLNTEIAMEMASEQGLEVASVLIHDDVAVDKDDNRQQ